MKLNLITSAVVATLYGASSMYAAAALQHQQVNKLEPLKLSPEQIANLQAPAQMTEDALPQGEGVNLQITPQYRKFEYEQGLTGEHVYIVRLNQKPLAQSSIGQQARSAKGGKGKMFVSGKPVNSEVAAYRAQLLDKQQMVLSEVAAKVGQAPVRQQFTNAINGFTMSLTQEQAEAVSKLAGVASVQRSKIYELQTDAGPELIQADKIWTGEVTQSVPYKGEGIIMGIVDTGVNTDSRSFADVGDDGYDHTNPWGSGNYVGDCTLEGFESLCNDKLIGVRSYPVITDNFTNGLFGAIVPPVGEDYQGHGSHTASTAAGNVLLDMDYISPEPGAASDGVVIKENLFPHMSGVAPHANIVSYQVCFPSNNVPGYQGCPGEALIGGIEDAITDGVDVINFSIGGQDSHPWTDDIELAFLAAREAGISVAVAAGNSGQPPGYKEYFGAIDHASPWLLNVAASTHGREIEIETKLTDPMGGAEAPKWSEIVGGAVNKESVTGMVVQAKNFGDEYCGTPFPAGTFDLTDSGGNPVDVIVVCKRNSLSDPNGIARSAKADNIKAGGADGMIMYNYANADAIVATAAYSVPSVHITKQEWDGLSENAYYGLADWLAKGTDHMLTISATAIDRVIDPSKADWLAAFSSRGPSPSTPEALIPAVAAPGVNIYAAYADEHPFTGSASGDYAFLSGTSMASPHAAGSMALLKQAHPDWTATEIQSALAMTAENKVQYHRLNDANGDVGLASTYRAGTGRINVANAVQAGLIMDETADNFRAADPLNGGAVHKLNIPQLVNFSCKPKCQWIRTVKATKDGSWTVTADDVMNWAYDMRSQMKQNGVNIKVSPSEFTLAAGETQAIVVEASIMDTQEWFSNAEVELHSNLIFTEASGKSPEAHWPVVFKYDMNDMPARLEATAHRNEGDAVLKGIKLPEGDSIHGRIFAPVKADVQTLVLPKDNDGFFPWTAGGENAAPMEDRLDEATATVLINVPANARRLIVESLGTTESPLDGTLDKGNLLVYVGKDYNGNGQPDPFEELLCVSNHIAYNNFCNINEPEEGQYWAVFYNSRKGSAQNNYLDFPEETFQYAAAVVTDDLAGNMSVDVPASNGKEPVDIQVNWNMPEMQAGDLYYSLIDFGTSAVNAGNIGKTAFKLNRGKDDVSLDVPQTAAREGDVIPFTFTVLPNDSGADRAFTISADVPADLSLSAEDVLASSSAIVTDISLENGKLTISGVQPDTRDLEPSYKISTNVEDAMCRTPNFGNSNPGGYVNLEEFRLYPQFGGFAPVEYDANGNAVRNKDNQLLYRNGIELPMDVVFRGAYDAFHLYNNTDNLNAGRENYLDIRAHGFVSLWGGQPLFYPWHDIFPYQNFPYESIGMLWRGFGLGAGATQAIMAAPLVNSMNERSGMTIASTNTGWAILEYDNARSYKPAGRDAKRVYQWEEQDDRFDFELIFNANTRYGDGEYELMMAYDNIDFGSQDARGSIGVQGFRGGLYAYGPLESYRGEQFAFNDLDEKLKNGLVICYDYQGPESSQFEVTAWTKVKPSAAGKTLAFNAVSQVEGMADIEINHEIKVPGNLSIGGIADQSVAENTTLEGIEVLYADEQNSVNQITVTGEHITATVSGNASGSTFSITPEKDFHGEVEVTVTVSDVENPSDAASTSFMLTVVSDGVEPQPPVVTPEPEPAPADSSSGGSTGPLALALLALFGGLRRRR
ncbi:S8 family serine peptidase [Shewanella cyperi]|uniref:S8 family serine peptidase n=2 Tax=Shewanella cyperi TaxID=2814292 RepID=A0A974XNP6_9GAMM|nr:S8 family serine peptidase [Shewanella cyperi]QSX30578.1 S8 family serine peptidase [Shewanella cyperi]